MNVEGLISYNNVFFFSLSPIHPLKFIFNVTSYEQWFLPALAELGILSLFSLCPMLMLFTAPILPYLNTFSCLSLYLTVISLRVDIVLFLFPDTQWVICRNIYCIHGLWSSPQGCLVAGKESPREIMLFLDYENLVPHFCPRAIINLYSGLCLRPQALLEVWVFTWDSDLSHGFPYRDPMQ